MFSNIIELIMLIIILNKNIVELIILLNIIKLILLIFILNKKI